MTRMELPEHCLEILRWLEGRPAEPSIALSKGCGVLSDLFKERPMTSQDDWEGRLRTLDDRQAIVVQLFSGRLQATDFFDGEYGLYCAWESPIRREGSGYDWSQIVSMGWPDFAFRKALIKGDMLPHLKRTFQQLKEKNPKLVKPKDPNRLSRPRIGLTEFGRTLLAIKRTAAIDRGASIPKSFHPTLRQQVVLSALDGKAMKVTTLAFATKINRRHLYDRGAQRGVLSDLRDRNLIVLHNRLGYYRPDSPPPELKESE